MDCSILSFQCSLNGDFISIHMHCVSRYLKQKWKCKRNEEYIIKKKEKIYIVHKETGHHRLAMMQQGYDFEFSTIPRHMSALWLVRRKRRYILLHHGSYARSPSHDVCFERNFFSIMAVAPGICEAPGCKAEASLQCPTCLKIGIQGSYFCSQVRIRYVYYRLSLTTVYSFGM